MTDLDILSQALSWMRNGATVMLATVVDTWGSAPRKAGAQMVIRKDGVFLGSVSGGCIEGTVIQNALEHTGTGRMLTFGVSTEDAWAVGLSCGGEISVWIEELLLDVVESLVMEIKDRHSVMLHLSLEAGTPMSLFHSCNPLVSPKTIRQTNGSAIRRYEPARRLFIVGAVHIAQALVPMAKHVGYQVLVIDPRNIFLDEQRWGGVEMIAEFPDEYLPSVNLGTRDAVVALSHNPTFDDDALYCALKHKVFYIGALGSRRNHVKRCVRLLEMGCSEEQVNRISGPIGLNINAQTPAEIAVSILAEMIQFQEIA